MAEKITPQQVRHVARLSRLALTDEQVTDFTRQLGDILEYVGKLEDLDVEDVEPMAHPADITNAMREDEPGEALTPDQALANAPDREDNFFQVPKVLGEGGA